MSERYRCFVAVPIGEDLRRELAAAVEQWRGREDLATLRWTDPDGWHVTLAFLGSVDVVALAELRDDLERVADAHAPFRLATGGVGGFPTRARSRVAWYGVADSERRLARLAADVAGALAPDADGRFRAHVTLARAKHEPVDLRPWVAVASAPAGELTVDQLGLMRSHLGRGPARYETLYTVVLRGEAND